MIFDFESIGLSLGLMKGDEIMVINGAIVSDLDMMFIESVLQEELTLCMMLRSSRPGKLYGTLHAIFTQPFIIIVFPHCIVFSLKYFPPFDSVRT